MSIEPFLTNEVLEQILAGIPTLSIAVIGDLFLDRYLDLDDRLTEPSLETGLGAYQVVHIRADPGAAGTVINNLAALGVGRILPLAVIGDDGEGYELRQTLATLSAVDPAGVLLATGRRTPTYTKPMLQVSGQPPRELNRLDIHNRVPLPAAMEDKVCDFLEQLWSKADGLVVLDQVSLPDCGVVTDRVRQRLSTLARRDSQRPVLADSRERIGLFEGVSLKPNQREAHKAVPGMSTEEALVALASRAGQPVYCTQGEEGILVADPVAKTVLAVPGYPVRGPIDPVGAGDSTSAGIICALAAGARREQAAAFGNLVASITVQQIGTTGTATPSQVRQRWREVLMNSNEKSA